MFQSISEQTYLLGISLNYDFKFWDKFFSSCLFSSWVITIKNLLFGAYNLFSSYQLVHVESVFFSQEVFPLKKAFQSFLSDPNIEIYSSDFFLRRQI